MTLRLAAPLALLIGASAACPRRGGDHAVARIQRAHPNGLALSLPARAFAVSQTATGFRLRPPGAGNMRAPARIDVDLVPGPGPAAGFPHTKTVDGRLAHYRIDSTGGGSGGDEYALTAWVAAAAGHIVVVERLQVEPPPEPDFNLAWTVLAGASQ